MSRFTVTGLVLTVAIATFGQVAGNRLNQMLDHFVMTVQLPSAGYTMYDEVFTPDHNRPAEGSCRNGPAYWRC